MQRTLLGAAIALILVLVTALVGPLFIDWGRYRDTLETEISRLTRSAVRIRGPIDVRILPTPTLKLQQIAMGRSDGPAMVQVETLRIELALGALMRGEFVASDVALEAPEISLRLGGSERLYAPGPLPNPPPQAGEGKPGAGGEGGEGVFAFDPDALSIAHLAIEKGRVNLAGGPGRSLLIDRLGFSGEVRSLLGPAKGDGSISVDGENYLFSIATGRVAADGAVKVRLLVDTVDHVRIGDVDSSIWIERGIPHFVGALQWSQPGGRSLQGFNELWRLSAKMRGDWTAAAVEGINLQYGSEERAVQLRGNANITFRAQPELDVTLAATRIDLDRMLGFPAVRRRPLAALRTMADSFDAARLPLIHVNLGISADAVTLAEAPLQQVSASLRGAGGAWDLDSLELRAPGGTQLRLRGRLDLAPRTTAFAGQGRIEARDSRSLVSWLTAGSDGEAFAGPFRAEGDVRLSGESVVFDRFKAEFDRDTLEGNFGYFGPTADRPARIAATLTASNIDLQRASAFVQHVSGDTAIAWPHEGSLSLNVRQVSIPGVEAKRADMRLRFDERALTIDRLAIDDLGGARLVAAGSIDMRTLAPKSAITLDLDVNAPDGVAALVEKLNAPAAAALRRNAPRLLPARLKGSLASDTQAASDAGMAAGLSFKIDGSAGAFALNLQGVTEVPGDGSLLATFAQLDTAKLAVAGRIDARDGRTLVEAVGLDRLLSVDDRAGRLDIKASGRLGGPMTATARATAGGLGVSLDGTLQSAQSQAATADLAFSVAQANVRLPQAGALPTTFTARLNYADGTFALNEIAGTVAGNDIAGRLAIGLTPTMSLGGDIKLGAMDVPAGIATAVGMPAKRVGGGLAWSADPFAGGVLGQFRGRIAIAAARTMLTPHLVAGNLRGVLNFGASDIALDDFQADIAGGRVSGRLAFERDGDELVARSHVRLTKADMAALLPNDRPPISGRLSMDAEIEGRGRSPAALIGSLQGKGFFSIEDGKFAALDPSAFDAVIRSVDQGLPIEVTRIRGRVEEALARGALAVQGDGAVTAAAGTASLTANRLRAEGADLAVSARYDLVAEALDAKLTLARPAGAGSGSAGRPEIAVSLQGPIDSPRRTLDVAALVDWLSTRAIAENTKRLAAMAAPPDARPIEPPQTQPPAARPSVPDNSAAVVKPVPPAEGVKTAAPAIPPDSAKPEPAANPVVVAKPEAPANPPAAEKPAGDALAAAKPPPAPPPQAEEGKSVYPPPLAGEGREGANPPAAASDIAAVGIRGQASLAPAEPPADPRIAELDRAIAANPNNYAALAERGQRFAIHDNYGSAIKDFDEVIRLRPQDPEGYNNRCWVRAIIGDLQSALNDCNVALQLHPRYADAFDSRGMINLKSGQLGKAIADYDAALRLDPRRPSSLYGRGIAKIRNNNPASGNVDIDKAKSMQPNIAEEFAGYGIH
jgi:large subunit ribosomal protein L24